MGRAGSLPLETLQYVVGVGYYRTVLKQHESALRTHASRIRLDVMDTATDWNELSQRPGLPVVELRLHNPFVASRRLRAGDLVAVPPGARRSLLTPTDSGMFYRMRHGDHYITLAHTLGVDLDALRAANDIWHTQVVPTGTILRLPLTIDPRQAPSRAEGDRTFQSAGAAATPDDEQTDGRATGRRGIA